MLNKKVVFILFFLLSQANANELIFHKFPKEGVSCPADKKLLANDLLEAEFHGRRTEEASRDCFESLNLKYIHTAKDPIEFVSKFTKIKNFEVVSVEYNKSFFTYNVKFKVQSVEGGSLEDQFSFMLNGEVGETKPKKGCANHVAQPKKVFVYNKCFK